MYAARWRLDLRGVAARGWGQLCPDCRHSPVFERRWSVPGRPS